MRGMSERLNKTDAAARLKVSERSLERYVKAGRITANYETGADSKGRAKELAFFDIHALDALKAEMDAPPPAPLVKAAPAALSVEPPAAPHSPPDTVTLAALVALSANGQSPLWLALKEAAALSGLPLADVRRAVDAGALATLNTGRGKRLRRDAVLSWAMNPTVREPQRKAVKKVG